VSDGRERTRSPACRLAAGRTGGVNLPGRVPGEDALVGPGVIGARTSNPSPRWNASSSCDIASPSASTMLATYCRQRNMNTFRRRSPPRGPRPRDIITLLRHQPPEEPMPAHSWAQSHGGRAHRGRRAARPWPPSTAAAPLSSASEPHRSFQVVAGAGFGPATFGL